MSSLLNSTPGHTLMQRGLLPKRGDRLKWLGRGAVAIAILLGIAGCGSTSSTRSGLFEPYKVDLPQGNYVTQEMVAQIRTGMTTDQVRFALGAPLLNSLFQPDIWSYVFRYKHAGGKVDLRRLVIHFKDQRVARVEGDDLPSGDDGSDPFLPGYKGTPNKGVQK
jgi:outer membrane protein assembly factor BamE